MKKWIEGLNDQPVLKMKFCLYRSIDPYNANPGSQGTARSGHKITIVMWPVGFRKHLSTLDT